MELLLSANPIIQQFVRTKSISNMYNRLVDEATQFNIATGFITNDSIAALKQIVEFREGDLCLSLFIGMNYLEGFTRPQYNAIKDLNKFLTDNNVGKIYLSTQALFHGKIYSFMKNESCLAAFVGSSNLGSFVGTSQNLIEADISFKDESGISINSYITQITKHLGSDFSTIPPIQSFKENDDNDILNGYSFVEKLDHDQLLDVLSSETGEYVDIPLKTEPKSNLNTYFGKGKIKGKYSPRGWYEVELIIGKDLTNRDLIPDKDDGPFTVVTQNGFQFECSRQGDNSKNFRSEKDLKILGRWIKGQMENCGALEIGQPVTEDTLQKFEKRYLRLSKTRIGKYIISLV